MSDKKIIRVEHLKKYYGKTRGVEDVSLIIKVGETYGFIGPNGAGKSTTIRTVMGLINKTSGTIYFDGKEMNPDDSETKKRIGYLPSEINLYDDMRVTNIPTEYELKFTSRGFIIYYIDVSK